MNTAGIPVYKLDAFSIQALLSQETETSVTATQVSSQDSKIDYVSTNFKV